MDNPLATAHRLLDTLDLDLPRGDCSTCRHGACETCFNCGQRCRMSAAVGELRSAVSALAAKHERLRCGGVLEKAEQDATDTVGQTDP